MPPRNASTWPPVPAKWRACTIRIGALTENTKPGGTCAAHFAYVSGFCARWNVPLISIALSLRLAYSSSRRWTSPGG